MPDRINARLSPDLERKVARVQARTKKSLTAIVTESLERYCDDVLAASEPAAERLAASGFIGCGEGPEDLSVDYKQELTRSLGRKA